MSRLSIGSIATKLVGMIIFLADMILRRKRGIVVRTFPDFDDQGLQLVDALVAQDTAKISWLTGSELAARPICLDSRVSVLPARSIRGVWAYCRAHVVVHTHGLYEVPRRSPQKTFVNLWHGMPVKRLDIRPSVAVRQTDILTVTSPLHGANIAKSWDLRADQIAITGLPRNDAFFADGVNEAPSELDGDGRPLVAWLPTYRSSVVGQIRIDGNDLGNIFQLPGADVKSVEGMAARLNVNLVIKVHPMADNPHGEFESPHLRIFSDDDLRSRGMSLYNFLAKADVLITDHSSVWIDFLLRDRPIIFAISDVESYARSRGHYFENLREWLPGPLVENLDDMESLLESIEELDIRWSSDRRKALKLHHDFRDGDSSDRVASIISSLVDRR